MTTVWRQLASVIAPPLCHACRQPVDSGHALCLPCGRDLAAMEQPFRILGGYGCQASFPLRGPARQLVHALKYGGNDRLARSMAALMVERLEPDFLVARSTDSGPTFVPVPLAKPRLRSRGFNQSALLALELAALTQGGYADLLARRKNGRRQTGQSRAARRALSPSTIELQAPAQSAKNFFVLVDDVVTTGATLELCAMTLASAGVNEVKTLAFAAATS